MVPSCAVSGCLNFLLVKRTARISPSLLEVSLVPLTKYCRKHGGVANGEPGERAQYSKGYYAAFVLDPLGNNIEVAHKNPS